MRANPSVARGESPGARLRDKPPSTRKTHLTPNPSPAERGEKRAARTPWLRVCARRGGRVYGRAGEPSPLATGWARGGQVASMLAPGLSPLATRECVRASPLAP